VNRQTARQERSWRRPPPTRDDFRGRRLRLLPHGPLVQLGDVLLYVHSSSVGSWQSPPWRLY
jgi:hypothetical protein